MTVFAAASLAAPFEVLAREFERLHPGRAVQLHGAGTPQLVLQLREGAGADVFASADEAQMARIAGLGLVAGAPTVFARNALSIVTAAGNPRGVTGLADLARPDLAVALCGPEVPAGRYAREACARAGVVARSLSDEPSVSAVLSKVRLGVLDAGIVYATDVRAAGTGVGAVSLAPEHAVVASYPIAALTAGGSPDGGRAFVAYVLSPAGQRVLTEFGFEVP